MGKSATKYRMPRFRPDYGKLLGAPSIHPYDVFGEIIQRDRTVCENCFIDRYDVEALEWSCGEQGWLRWDRYYPIAGRNDPEVAPKLRRGNPELLCSECGYNFRADRPLSTEKATQYALHLSESLTARKVKHDRETLLRSVRTTKQSGCNQEKKVFGESVARAVCYARGIDFENCKRR